MEKKVGGTQRDMCGEDKKGGGRVKVVVDGDRIHRLKKGNQQRGKERD